MLNNLTIGALIVLLVLSSRRSKLDPEGHIGKGDHVLVGVSTLACSRIQEKLLNSQTVNLLIRHRAQIVLGSTLGKQNNLSCWRKCIVCDLYSIGCNFESTVIFIHGKITAYSQSQKLDFFVVKISAYPSGLGTGFRRSDSWDNPSPAKWSQRFKIRPLPTSTCSRRITYWAKVQIRRNLLKSYSTRRLSNRTSCPYSIPLQNMPTPLGFRTQV